MTSDELRAKFNVAQRIIKAERHMRESVFQRNPDRLESKLREMDRLLQIVVDMKDALKVQMGIDGDETPMQATLLDVPVPEAQGWKRQYD